MDFSSVHLLCVGDIMLDRFGYGETERISPEAPVPVLRLRRTLSALGGAGNVARNVAALGGRATLIGLLGTDGAARTVEALLADAPGIHDATVRSPSRTTISKNRYLAANQQIIRVDEESTHALSPDEERDLRAAIEVALATCHAVVLSDYGKGVLGPALLAHAIALANARGIPVFVDPKGHDFSRYRGATCITPNTKELAAATRMPVETDGDVIAAARRVVADTGGAAVLVTRSSRGVMLVQADGLVADEPARRREVFDVSGAGDTVVATAALAFGSGLPLDTAMRIANAAAGIVVGKVGTATVAPEELRAELAQDGRAAHRSGAVPLRSREAVVGDVARWKAHGLSVGFTNGCFDVLHAGHVDLLMRARRECDRLVVAINDDASVSRLKGPGRPLNIAADRAAILGALRCVDAVVAFSEDTPLTLIRELAPDVLVKGGDYTPNTVIGAQEVRDRGGRVVIADLVPGRSTTALLKRAAAGS